MDIFDSAKLSDLRVGDLKRQEVKELLLGTLVAQVLGWKWCSYRGPANDRSLGNGEICKHFMSPEVNVVTWKKRYPEFAEATGDEPLGYLGRGPFPPQYQLDLNVAMDAAWVVFGRSLPYTLERDGKKCWRFRFGTTSRAAKSPLTITADTAPRAMCFAILNHWLALNTKG